MSDHKPSWATRMLNHRLADIGLPPALALIHFLILWFGTRALSSNIEQDSFEVVLASFFMRHGLVPTEVGLSYYGTLSFQTFPLVKWLFWAGFWMFGDDFRSPQTFTILLRSFSYPLLYLALRNLTSRSTALFASTLYAFSTLHLCGSAMPHERNFAEPFLFLSLLLVTTVRNAKSTGLLMFNMACSGAVLLIPLLTYNLSYVAPLSFLLIVVWAGLQRGDLTKKRVFGCVAFFSLFPLLFSPWIIRQLVHEFEAKKYALTNSPLAAGFLGSVFGNLKIALSKLFVSITYTTGDSLLDVPSTLIFPPVTIVAFAGLGIAFIRKPFRPYAWVFLLNFFFYQVLMGLWFPRGWLVTWMGMIILVGVALFHAECFCRRRRRGFALFVLVSILSTAAVSIQQWRLFVRNTTTSRFYVTPFADMLALVSTYQTTPQGTVAFVFPPLASSLYDEWFLAAGKYQEIKTHKAASYAVYGDDDPRVRRLLSDPRLEKVVVYRTALFQPASLRGRDFSKRTIGSFFTEYSLAGAPPGD